MVYKEKKKDCGVPNKFWSNTALRASKEVQGRSQLDKAKGKFRNVIYQRGKGKLYVSGLLNSKLFPDADPSGNWHHAICVDTDKGKFFDQYHAKGACMEEWFNCDEPYMSKIYRVYILKILPNKKKKKKKKRASCSAGSVAAEEAAGGGTAAGAEGAAAGGGGGGAAEGGAGGGAAAGAEGAAAGGGAAAEAAPPVDKEAAPAAAARFQPSPACPAEANAEASQVSPPPFDDPQPMRVHPYPPSFPVDVHIKYRWVQGVVRKKPQAHHRRPELSGVGRGAAGRQESRVREEESHRGRQKQLLLLSSHQDSWMRASRQRDDFTVSVLNQCAPNCLTADDLTTRSGPCTRSSWK